MGENMIIAPKIYSYSLSKIINILSICVSKILVQNFMFEPEKRSKESKREWEKVVYDTKTIKEQGHFDALFAYNRRNL